MENEDSISTPVGGGAAGSPPRPEYYPSIRKRYGVYMCPLVHHAAKVYAARHNTNVGNMIEIGLRDIMGKEADIHY